MKTNTYTAAISSVHVSEAAIEAAITAARLRAAQTASNQIKLRYAAVAASVVLAGVGGYALYQGAGSFSPPVSPVPVPASTVAETLSAETQSSTVQETRPHAASSTAKPTVTPTAGETSQPANSRTEQPAENTDETQTPAATQKPTEKTGGTVKPTVPAKPTQPPTSPSAETTVSRIVIDPISIKIEKSELGEDGKLYMMIAPTGLSKIDDPEAFTDEHVYYYETKFGRFYIRPLTIDPEEYLFPNDRPASLADSLCYFYNSRGEILSASSLRWDI